MASKKVTNPIKKKTQGSMKMSAPKSGSARRNVLKGSTPKGKDAKAPLRTAEGKTGRKEKDLTPRQERILLIRMDLVRQRETLLSEAEAALNDLPGQTIFPDLGDQATAETDRNFMLRLRGREQRLLKKIEEAINRIDCGSFGICDDCGNEIDLKRLQARPVTTMCIECKTLQEEEEKLREQ